MRFRAGVVVGFGAGYYLGSKAGRERHAQINRVLRKVKRSDAFEEATEKAKAAVDLGVERAKDFVDTKKNEHSDGNGSTPKLDKDALQGAPAPF